MNGLVFISARPGRYCGKDPGVDDQECLEVVDAAWGWLQVTTHVMTYVLKLQTALCEGGELNPPKCCRSVRSRMLSTDCMEPRATRKVVAASMLQLVYARFTIELDS